MRTTLSAWNVKGALEYEERANQAVRDIDDLDSDVLVLSEAFHDGISPEAEIGLRGLGYSITAVNRQPDDSRKYRMTALLDRTGSKVQPIQLGERAAVSCTNDGAGLHVVGAHLSDESEASRVNSIDKYLEIVNPDIPSVLMGDLNAMFGDTRLAKLLRLPGVGRLSGLVPNERLISLSSRLISMASGETIAKLDKAGYVDADHKYQPTMKFGRFAVAQLDHILHNPHATSSSFERHDSSLSDHMAIKAVIES